jgi:hypothetical protein
MVATHEHYDHLSGFILANDAFTNFKIDKVWMAWTEDPADSLANSYRNKKRKALAALALLSENPAFAATSEMQTVQNLLQFYGPIDKNPTKSMRAAGSESGGKLAGNSSCEDALEWLKRKAGISNVSFLKPGEVVRWGVDSALRAYVLGPPRNDSKLRQLNPSKGEAREVYLRRAEESSTEYTAIHSDDGTRTYILDQPHQDTSSGQFDSSQHPPREFLLARGEDIETLSGLAAIHSLAARDLQLGDIPFAPPFWRPYESGGRKKKRSSKERKLSDPVVKLYEQKDPESLRRRIDGEWLGSAENLALKIDGDVNNTSLALALELSDKQVLLFPGDAQVGNWLSWSDQAYPSADSKDAPKLRIEDLLSRTILYKVGHHASHNATLRERGLELMTDPNLCAMIPVVEKTAREQKTSKTPDGWAMPYAALNKRLEESTKGRIVRGDGSPSVESAKFEKSLFKLTYGENFGPKDPLWVELSTK